MKTKIQKEWNLRLFYKSHADPKIEADLKKCEALHEAFAKKYKDADFTKDESALSKALADYEQLAGDSSGSRPYLYFHYSKDINSEDKKAEAEISKLSDRLTKASNKVLFFELALAKIAEPQQKKYLASPALAHYRYFLLNIFKRAKHNLSEAEEKIVSLKSIPARQLWMSYQDKQLARQTIMWKKKEIPVEEAFSMIPTLPTKERRALHELCMKKMRDISDFAEAEMNAVYTNKKIDDELRGFKNPWDATLLGHETDESMVNALSDAVTRANKISHRFYKLKAKLIKVDRLTYADRGAGYGTTDRKIPFEQALEIVRKGFGAMDPDFRDMLDRFMSNGQIDVFPKKGKTGGAYCSGNIDTPTLILLNHVPEMRSVSTLAHEMGHAIHFEYSKTQKPLYQGVSTAVAEVASTFFEEVIFDDLFKTLSKKEQIAALHNKLNDEMSTIFRQIACFNFEKELHKVIREKGAIGKEEIGSIHNKHMKSYLGPATEMKEDDGYFFVRWGHIRNFFYVYSYAFGCLVSKALYRKYKQDPAYLAEIKTFLEAGNSKSPRDIFNDIGIDTSDPAFWQEGLAQIEEDIKRLEALTK